MYNGGPTVSIIIPCRNELTFVERCLSSVLAFEPVPGGCEVIVVDGGSTDGTRAVLSRWQAAHPQIRLLDNPARIVPVAMNLGIGAARGRLILRLDMHAEYPPDYMRRCFEVSERTGADNVGGVVITLSRDSTPQGRMVQALTTHRFGVGNAGFRVGAQEGAADTVPYGCFRRATFERVGRYDERLVRNQDYELNRRLLAAGGTIWCDPAIQVRYFNQNTLRGLLRQAVFTGQWNPWMWYLAPYSFAPRHAVPAAFVLGLGGASGLAALGRPGRMLLALVLLPYFMLAAAAAWQQSWRYGPWMLPVLPLLFFAYHLAYGVGVLRGAFALLRGRAPIQRQGEPWPGAGVQRIDPRRQTRPTLTQEVP